MHHWHVVALHFHHHVRGPKGDYIGLGAAAFASWFGIPGAGEAALVAAGILAAHNHLDIAVAILVAWFGATVGGVAGWLVGLKAGRAVLSKPGPLYRLRMSALARGDRFFDRYGTIAIFFAPTWVAGIHGMRASRFLPVNAVAALCWALVVGLGAYFVGPSIVDLIDDLGIVSAVVVAALIVAAVVAMRRARRHRRAHTAE